MSDLSICLVNRGHNKFQFGTAAHRYSASTLVDRRTAPPVVVVDYWTVIVTGSDMTGGS